MCGSQGPPQASARGADEEGRTLERSRAGIPQHRRHASFSHRNVVRSFKALLTRAGLPAGTRLYDLRHTCATLLLNSNVHPKYVQELLGHASIAQTLDTYSRVLKGMDSGIGDAMDAAVG
jgi:integrase